MQIKSTSFDNNEAIPSVFTCQGDNINPPLALSAVPSDAKSLAIWMHDPDAPAGDFSHWIVWNISPSITEIQEGILPSGAIEGKNDFGTAGYGGPCPPKGTGAHHYIFELFALADTIIMPSNTPVRDVRAALQAHVLAHAALTGIVSA